MENFKSWKSFTENFWVTEKFESQKTESWKSFMENFESQKTFTENFESWKTFGFQKNLSHGKLSRKTLSHRKLLGHRKI